MKNMYKQRFTVCLPPSGHLSLPPIKWMSPGDLQKRKVPKVKRNVVFCFRKAVFLFFWNVQWIGAYKRRFGTDFKAVVGQGNLSYVHLRMLFLEVINVIGIVTVTRSRV